MPEEYRGQSLASGCTSPPHQSATAVNINRDCEIYFFTILQRQ